MVSRQPELGSVGITLITRPRARVGVTFLATIAVLVVSQVFVARSVDPRGDFGGRRFPKVVYDARAQKQALFQKYLARGPVEGLVLGSSRSMKLRPSELKEHSGLRFFNFAVDLGQGEDFLAIYRWVREQGTRPKVVVIGLDTEALASDRPRHWKLEKNRELRAMLEPDPITALAGMRMWVARYKETLSLPYVGDTLLSLRLWLRPHEDLLNVAFQTDGYLRYPRWERERARRVFDLDREIQACLPGQLKLFGGLGRARPERVAELERLVAAARNDGAIVKILMIGLHPSTVRFLTAKGTAVEAQTVINRAVVEDLKRRYGVESYDFSVLGPYGGTKTGWYDCAHVDETNATLMTRALMARVL